MSDKDTSRYITKVRIENFQSHEDTEFELSPGLNVIVGSSENGKSAILRAINFVLHNQPRGDDFVRMDTEETRVHLWFSDGSYVCRIKGGPSERNAVLWRTPEGEEDGRDKIGDHLPAEVVKLLGKPPIDEWHGPISYADQMAPLFLVSLGPTNLPRAISKLIGIDDFEEAAKRLSSQANEAKKQIKDSTARVARLDEQLKEYQFLDEQLEELDELETLATNIEQRFEKINQARSLLDKYADVMKQGRAAFKILTKAKQVAALSGEVAPARELFSKISGMRSLIRDHERLQNDEASAQKSLTTAQALCSRKIKLLYADAYEAIEIFLLASDFLEEYQELMQTGSRLKNEREEWTEKLSELTEEKNQIVAEMKEAGLWCDTCQRPLALDECA